MRATTVAAKITGISTAVAPELYNMPQLQKILLPCIEVWCPWFNKIGEAKREVTQCYYGISTDQRMGGFLQDGEQQLQMFLTKLRAEETKEHKW